jgi:hypothetical protein
MKLLDNIVCPVSNKKIDGNINRLAVFIDVLLLVGYLLTGSPYFVAFIVLDYATKAFDKAEYSPLNWIASRIAKIINLPTKMVDQAPKLFAVRVGFIISLIVLISYLIDLQTVSIIAAFVLLTFTTMDSVLNICVGCLMYHYLVFPLYKRKLAV